VRGGVHACVCVLVGGRQKQLSILNMSGNLIRESMITANSMWYILGVVV